MVHQGLVVLVIVPNSWTPARLAFLQSTETEIKYELDRWWVRTATSTFACFYKVEEQGELGLQPKGPPLQAGAGVESVEDQRVSPNKVIEIDGHCVRVS